MQFEDHLDLRALSLDTHPMNVRYVSLLALLSSSLWACGDGTENITPDPDGGVEQPPTTAAIPALEILSVKTFRFSWTDVSDASYYKLLEDPDGVSGFDQVGADVPAAEESAELLVPLFARANAAYVLQSCNAAGCIDSAVLSAGNALAAIGYVKASNSGNDDSFGAAVTLSADGSTLAVGAAVESSSATGIGGDQADDGAPAAGAVYIFVRDGAMWTQQEYLKASNAEGGDVFGYSLALSDNGNTLAVGALFEEDAAGAAYVFARTGSTWSEEALLKGSNTEAGDQFGGAVALSSDGNTLAVGAIGEDGNGTGEGDNSVPFAGAAYLFTRTATDWNQEAYIKSGNVDENDGFGSAVALSNDGDTLAIGSLGESSDADGVGGDPTDNSASGAGAVFVFSRSAAVWSEDAYIKASNSDSQDSFGQAVALSGDGNTLAVGARQEGSNAVGVSGDEADNSAALSGAVYVFARAGGTWSQEAYAKANNSDEGDGFGWSVALSDDGNTLSVGAVNEDGSGVGVDGDAADNATPSSGAAYTYVRAQGAWSHQSYIKATNPETDANLLVADTFGWSVSLSADGSTLAVGAVGEDSSATGLGGDEADNAGPNSGAVYLY